MGQPGLTPGISAGLAKIAARGGGNFADGLMIELREMAKEIAPNVARLRAEIPLTEPEARKAGLDVMKKGYTAEKGVDALLEEVHKLKRRGLTFDADRIAQFPEVPDAR